MAEGRIAQPRVYVRSKSKMAADLERQYVQRQEMDPRGSKVGTFALLDGKGNPGFGRNRIKRWDSCKQQHTPTHESLRVRVRGRLVGREGD